MSVHTTSKDLCHGEDNVAKAIAAGDEQPHRRDLILEAAIELFRAKGFDATGIDEIGAAAGVTGPAVYRHYESKQDILDWAVRVGTTEVLRTERKIVAGADSPGEALALLVAELVEQVLDRPALVTVLLRERRNLSPTGNRNWARALRAYTAEWVTPLRKLRPAMSKNEAEVTVYCAIGIVTSIASRTDVIGLSRKALAARLRGMMLAALLASPT
jgi:AcrR family transcriptional regulator